jgi:hypothetical protein
MLAVLSASVYGQTSCQSELNGFLLGQYKKTVNSLGQPFKTGDENGWPFQAYQLPPDGYMVVSFDPREADQIAAIQISGQVTGMHPFLGIKLGDTEKTLEDRLGRPGKKTREEGEELFLLEYSGRNYTFEIDTKGRISSIRIVNDCPHQSPGKALAPEGSPLVEELLKALATHNVDLLMQVLAPDLEIYKSGDAYAFTRGARAELEKGDTAFSRLLFSPNGSVLAALKDEGPRADEQIRLYQKHQPAHVIKFPDSKIIAEIVYDFQGGRWKVYEIRFR